MKKSRLVVCWVAALSLLLAGAGKIYAQAIYGTIIGTVTDAQGGAVSGAKVTVTSVTKGTTDETTTNESGNYTVTHLIPDVYKIRIEASGFKAYDIASVQVSADTAANADASLAVGDVTQSIEVTGEMPQLKTDRSDVAIEFNERYVEDLPVLNRNFTNFELLSPGTQKLVGWSHAATENPQGGGQIFVNGQHFSGTGFELDGTDNQDPILGIIVINPNLEAVTETKMTLQNFDAESGKAVAGRVTVQTKSGSNEIHGSGFYFYRGSGQEARDPFTNAPNVGLPSASWKQFGGSVGGPIIKDKLFFFGDYQGTRQIAGITNPLTIPTALVEQSCNPKTNTTGFCDLSQYLGTYSGGGQAYDPTTSNALDGSGRTAFPDNHIPITELSQQAINVLSLFPVPSNGNLTNNYIATGSGPFNQNAFDIRIDYAAPHDYQVFGRYSQDYFNLSGKGSLGFLGAVGFGPGGLNGESTVHNYSLASGFTKSINSHLLTDFRFGYFKYNPETNYSDAGTTPMDTLGIPGLNLPNSPSTTGLASFFLQQGGNNDQFSPFGDGLNVGRCNCPLTESEQQFQFVNNWTIIKGNHTIKFGADIRYAMNLRVPSDANRTGELYFDAGGTSNAGAEGLSLATFLLGDATSFQRFVSSSLDAAERQKRWFFFGQDTWRITPKLTLSYGLRWEIYFPESVNAKGNGGFANLTNGTIDVAGYGLYGLDGNVKNTLKAFGPRLGIAYQFNPNTVVRLGYGRSFDIGVFGSNYGHVVTQNLPVLANQTLADSNTLTCPTPGCTISNNVSPVFNLATGPPQFNFSQILNDITPQGTLPLLGPAGNVVPRMRPNKQVLPTLDAWNASVQRQLTKTISLEVTYLGNKGTHVFAGTGPSYNNNQVAVGDGTNIITCSITPIPVGGCPQKALTSSFVANTSATSRRPYPQYPVDLTWFGNNASSNYNALQIKAEKRFSNGLQFLAHFTYSHANAFDSNYYADDPRVAYGPDPWNRNRVFVINTVYNLPVGKGQKFMGNANKALDYIVGGWQIANTLNWSSGLPWTPSIGECGAISDAGCRPNIVKGQSFKVGAQRINGVWYDFVPVAPLTYPAFTPNQLGEDTCTFARPTSGMFALPACGTYGDAGVYSFTGPGAFSDDMSLTKNFTITERVKAQFRFDAYNVFNHPILGFNSSQGNTCVDCGGNAGQITDIEADASPGSPNGMRQLQFGVKVIF